LLNNLKITHHTFSFKTLTKWQNKKKALGNTVTEGVLEVVFCATIEWE